MTLDNEVVEFKEGTCIKFQKKISEGKSKKLARKHLARQVSNQFFLQIHSADLLPFEPIVTIFQNS